MNDLDNIPAIRLAPGFASNDERRAAAARASAEREEWRQRQLILQSSPHDTPTERIKVWEAFHGLDLPRAQGHKLLRVIAEQTNLPIADVVAEQRRRAESNSP
jgi:hypothetical protein